VFFHGTFAGSLIPYEQLVEYYKQKDIELKPYSLSQLTLFKKIYPQREQNNSELKITEPTTGLR
jgi:hypothetical protein